jgi:hypothetical protein
MANTGGFFDNLSQSLVGGGPSALQQLQNNGYSQYQMTNAPNTSGFFKGYQSQNANTSANAPYQAAQGQLLGQLQSQANGTGGPTVADQQLRSGLAGTIAAQKSAMAGARGQNAGLADKTLMTNATNAETGYSGQAAAQRAGEQQNAQSQLGGLTGQAIGQGNQLAEANQSAQNQAGQFNAGLQAQYGGLQNQNWQFGNNLMAQQQSQQNAAVAGQTNQALAQEQQMMGNPLNQIGSMVSTGAQLIGAGAMMEDGGVVGMDSGGVVLPGPATNNWSIPTLPSVSLGSAGPQYMQPIQGIGGGGKKPGQPAPDTTPNADPNTTFGQAATPDAGPDPMQGTGGALGGGADMGGLGIGLADGGYVGQSNAVRAPVANAPTEAVIGENGPEAVVPIKPNGDVDPARARDPGVQTLLANHPEMQHIKPAPGKQEWEANGVADRSTAAALAMAGAKLSDRVAELENAFHSAIPSLARRNRRAAA